MPTSDKNLDWTTKDVANWTIKNVPVATRKQAIACAAANGESVAAWMTRAVATQASLSEDKGGPPVDTTAGPATDIATLSTAMLATAAACMASEIKLSAAMTHRFISIMDDMLRTAKMPVSR